MLGSLLCPLNIICQKKCDFSWNAYFLQTSLKKFQIWTYFCIFEILWLNNQHYYFITTCFTIYLLHLFWHVNIPSNSLLVLPKKQYTSEQWIQLVLIKLIIDEQRRLFYVVGHGISEPYLIKAIYQTVCGKVRYALLRKLCNKGRIRATDLDGLICRVALWTYPTLIRFSVSILLFYVP